MGAENSPALEKPRLFTPFRAAIFVILLTGSMVGNFAHKIHKQEKEKEKIARYCGDCHYENGKSNHPQTEDVLNGEGLAGAPDHLKLVQEKGCIVCHAADTLSADAHNGTNLVKQKLYERGLYEIPNPITIPLEDIKKRTQCGSHHNLTSSVHFFTEEHKDFGCAFCHPSHREPDQAKTESKEVEEKPSKANPKDTTDCKKCHKLPEKKPDFIFEKQYFTFENSKCENDQCHDLESKGKGFHKTGNKAGFYHHIGKGFFNKQKKCTDCHPYEYVIRKDMRSKLIRLCGEGCHYSRFKTGEIAEKFKKSVSKFDKKNEYHNKNNNRSKNKVGGGFSHPQRQGKR